MNDAASRRTVEQHRYARGSGSNASLARMSGNPMKPPANQRSPTLDWNAVASRILAVLLAIKRDKRTVLQQAGRRGISLEQLTAAAIAGAVAEYLEDRRSE